MWWGHYFPLKHLSCAKLVQLLGSPKWNVTNKALSSDAQSLSGLQANTWANAIMSKAMNLGVLCARQEDGEWFSNSEWPLGRLVRASGLQPEQAEGSVMPSSQFQPDLHSGTLSPSDQTFLGSHYTFSPNTTLEFWAHSLLHTLLWQLGAFFGLS
jgi:hypothetical protein